MELGGLHHVTAVTGDLPTTDDVPKYAAGDVAQAEEITPTRAGNCASLVL